jgi:hypothetical protein
MRARNFVAVDRGERVSSERSAQCLAVREHYSDARAEAA